MPAFRINLKLENISVTSKLVKKVVTNLESSKVSGPDCIAVVILKNCEPELSYTLAELFNMCLKEIFFLDCLRGFKNYYLLVFFLLLIKSWNNLWIIYLLITSRYVVFFLISFMLSVQFDHI